MENYDEKNTDYSPGNLGRSAKPHLPDLRSPMPSTGSPDACAIRFWGRFNTGCRLVSGLVVQLWHSVEALVAAQPGFACAPSTDCPVQEQDGALPGHAGDPLEHGDTEARFRRCDLPERSQGHHSSKSIAFSIWPEVPGGALADGTFEARLDHHRRIVRDFQEHACPARGDADRVSFLEVQASILLG